MEQFIETSCNYYERFLLIWSLRDEKLIKYDR